MTERAFTELGAMAADLRAVPKALDRLGAEIERITRAYLDECYARGEGPDGDKWPLTNKGAKPNITGSYTTVNWVDGTLYIRSRWYNAMHDTGTARGEKVRHLLPQGDVPPPLLQRWEKALQDALTAALAQGVQ